MSMRFGDLFKNWSDLFGERIATGIAYDSRKVTPGGIFVAIPGTTMDGHAFIEDAITRGAAVIVGEREETGFPAGVTFIQVPDARIALTEISAEWFDYPAKKLTILAVTGSNGKTTSTYLMQSVLKAANKKCAVFGTIGHVIGGVHRNTVHTTPESFDLQSLFADAVSAGDRFVAMEVSSHALALNRVHGVPFEGAIWTNLTQDHLDFHQTMDNYFAAKSELFEGASAANIRIVNKDDEYASRMLKHKGIFSFAIDQPVANYRATQIRYGNTGTEFVANGVQAGPLHLMSQFYGKYNVQNVLGVVALMDRLGIDGKSITSGIHSLSGVPGRLQKISSKPGVKVFIDYAHTPDAIENVIRTAREFTKGKLHIVFGCGGNRDKTKRPLMGVAACLGDLVYVTSDNPRFEEPDAIIADILPGMKDHLKKAIVEADRKTAIRTACKALKENDVLLVLGKGAEEYLEIKGVRHPYSDELEVTKGLVAAGWGNA